EFCCAKLCAKKFFGASVWPLDRTTLIRSRSVSLRRAYFRNYLSAGAIEVNEIPGSQILNLQVIHQENSSAKVRLYICGNLGPLLVHGFTNIKCVSAWVALFETGKSQRVPIVEDRRGYSL